MNPLVYKIVMSVQNLKTKDKKFVDILSVDVHYWKTPEDRAAFQKFVNADKAKEASEKISVVSGQIALDANREFKRQVNAIIDEVLRLKEGK
jgi:hypothetical protein